VSRGIYCKLRFLLLFKYGISVAFSVLNYGSRDSIKLLVFRKVIGLETRRNRASLRSSSLGG